MCISVQVRVRRQVVPQNWSQVSVVTSLQVEDEVQVQTRVLVRIQILVRAQEMVLLKVLEQT